MIYFAVIDTNVLISGILKRPFIPNDIIKKYLVSIIVPLINEKIIAEYREVTARPKFHFPISFVETLMNSIFTEISGKILFLPIKNFPLIWLLAI